MLDMKNKYQILVGVPEVNNLEDMCMHDRMILK
jgi:hypothetical protein